MRDEKSALPSEVCYLCYLARERQARLRADEPDSPSGAMAMLEGDDGSRIASSEAANLPIVRLALQDPRLAEQAKMDGELMLEGAALRRIEALLRGEIRAQLDAYEPPPAPASSWAEPRDAGRATFEEKEFEFDRRFDKAGLELYLAMSQLEKLERAIELGQRYWVVFRQGMTARTDRVLRAVLAVGGEASRAALVEALAGELHAGEVREVLSRLEGLGHLRAEGERVLLTKKGRLVLLRASRRSPSARENSIP